MALDIKKLRGKLRLPQGAFAKILGVHAQTISKWERGKLSPSLFQQSLLRAFEVSVRYDPDIGIKARVLTDLDHNVQALYTLLRPSQK